MGTDQKPPEPRFAVVESRSLDGDPEHTEAKPESGP
jgi:hypothetical protein